MHACKLADMQYSGDVSLREQKKEQTRQALIAAAERLFDEQGYEGTTVEQIAAAANVSTRTFFTYFRHKADVLYHNSTESVEAALRVIASRAPDESPTQLLARAFDRLLQDNWEMGMYAGLIGHALTLPIASPKASIERSNARLERLAAALVEVCPEEVDRVGSYAMVGAAIGAVSAAVGAALGEERTDEEALEAGRCACRRALAGFDQSLEAGSGDDGRSPGP
jgi:AcrR family transcriptional regulator